MTTAQEGLQSETAAMLRTTFDKQRVSYLADPVPTYKRRRGDLLKLKADDQ